LSPAAFYDQKRDQNAICGWGSVPDPAGERTAVRSTDPLAGFKGAAPWRDGRKNARGRDGRMGEGENGMDISRGGTRNGEGRKESLPTHF